MPDFLTFQLYGPLAAFGGIAVGEVRPCDASPAKSAVLGLVAAALGLARSEDAAQARLCAAYRLALRLDRAGDHLRDFHTIQTPQIGRRQILSTRKDELDGRARINTIVSRRDYRCDVLAMACLWPADETPPHDLDELAAALARPVFAPYFGRRACPLGLPLAPLSGGFPDFAAALAARPPDRDLLYRIAPKEGETVPAFWEGPDDAGRAPEISGPRRDAVLSRRRWQFAEREEKRGHVRVPGRRP
jgi:CRISPR system Cascade subunit CasD